MEKDFKIGDTIRANNRCTLLIPSFIACIEKRVWGYTFYVLKNDSKLSLFFIPRFDDSFDYTEKDVFSNVYSSKILLTERCKKFKV